MENKFAQVYTSLLKTIKDNYEIDELDDYNIIDASFLLEAFPHLNFDKKKVLGVFRQMYCDSQMGFYSVPYFHRATAEEEYFPEVKMLKPRRQAKETFWQKIGFSSSGKWLDAEYSVSEDYTPKKLIYETLNSQQAKSVDLPSQSITSNWNDICAWEVFLLDNLKYFLPAFGSGLYMYRELICSSERLLKLPQEVRDNILLSDEGLLPHFEYSNGMVRIIVHYFNKWEGLVKWTVPYCTVDDIATPDSLCCYNKLIMPGETKEVIVRYDCGTRY